MKIKSFLIGVTGFSFMVFGVYLYIFPIETEYLQTPAVAYVDGAPAPQIESWEMY